MATQKHKKKTLYRIAACQLSTTMDPEENFEAMSELIDQATRLKADCIAFPENSIFFGSGLDLLQKESPHIENKILAKLAQKSHSISIHIGSVALWNSKNNKFSNSAIVFKNRKQLSRYDKIHLFDTLVSGDRHYRESDTIIAGKKECAFRDQGIVFGHSICFDLRFPSLYQNLSRKKGAEVFFIPSAFTYLTGQKHWDILTRARAIENQSFIIAPAQGGRHENGRKTWGHTRIIGPDGEILAETNSKNSLIYSDIDIESVRTLRREFPVVISPN